MSAALDSSGPMETSYWYIRIWLENLLWKQKSNALVPMFTQHLDWMILPAQNLDVYEGQKCKSGKESSTITGQIFCGYTVWKAGSKTSDINITTEMSSSDIKRLILFCVA